jgi:glycine/D-amino acid oxidase-like deaminating enzyme
VKSFEISHTYAYSVDPVNMSHIVILGAGVSGLTTALELSKDGRYSITIVAKFMPGDLDIEYVSGRSDAIRWGLLREQTLSILEL